MEDQKVKVKSGEKRKEERRKGSIIRLRLVNFQSYKDVTFHFGECLNMIVGPNGSGKSSVSNALAFVLGGSPKTLNKLTKITDHIRRGEEYSEIEAAISSGRGEVVIKRRIARRGENITVEGKSVTLKRLGEMVRELGIDVENMCEFLPQDKVSEFTKISEEEQLMVTLKNCRREDLVRTKEEIEERQRVGEGREKEVREREVEIEGLKGRLKGLEKSAVECRRFMEIEREVKLLEGRVQWILYEREKREYERKREEHRNMAIKKEECKRERRRVEEEVRKGVEEVREMEVKGEGEALREENHRLKKALREIKNMQREWREREREEERRREEVKEKGREVEEEEKKVEEIKKKIKKYLEAKEASSSEFQDQDENENENEREKEDEGGKESENECQDRANIGRGGKRGEIEEKEGKVKKMMERVLQLEIEGSECTRRINTLSKEVLDREEEIKNRLMGLRGLSKDTYEAVVLLRGDKEFRGEGGVLLPLYLLLPKTTKYRDEIESFFGYTLLTSFVCKGKKEFERFTRKYKEEKKLKINVVEIPEVFPEMERGERERVERMGFEGYLIDFVECVEEVRILLAVVGQLHRIPVTDKEIDESLLFKECRLITKAVINGKYVEIKRSRYGKDYTILSRLIRGGDRGVIAGDGRGGREETEKEIERIRGRVEEWREKREKIAEEYRKILREKEEEDGRLAVLYRARREYEERREEYRNVERIVSELNSVVAVSEGVIERKRERMEEMERERERERREGEEGERRSVVFELFRFLSDQRYITIFSNTYTTYKKVKEKVEEISRKKSRVSEWREEEAALGGEIRRVGMEKIQLYGRVKELMVSAKSKVELTEEVVEELSRLPDKEEVLEKEILVGKAKLRNMISDRSALTEYSSTEEAIKEREREAAELVAMHESDSRKIMRDANVLKKEIELIIAKISNGYALLFGEMGREGEVRASCGSPRVREWSLSIYVQFRKGEELQLLTFSRQSGGEKSISTILYLLSLQSVHGSSFRLVDEINQGMDAKNEVKVHNLLVKISERDLQTQFIVITPKLVPGLRYSRDTKIHTIFQRRTGRAE